MENIMSEDKRVVRIASVSRKLLIKLDSTKNEI
jgi:hypothetical protein